MVEEDDLVKAAVVADLVAGTMLFSGLLWIKWYQILCGEGEGGGLSEKMTTDSGGNEGISLAYSRDVKPPIPG